MEEKKDAELVILARSGNLDAFGRLVERYQDLMKSFALRMLDNEDIALEMVQESLLQAFLSIQSLNDPDLFKSWLYGIVVNVCRNYLRREHSKDLKIDELTESMQYNDNLFFMEDPEDLIEKLEVENQFLSLIHSLKPIYREIILLYYYRHMRLGEIVEQEGLSLETVKVRLYRARGMLREQLRRLYPEMDREILPEDRRKTMLGVMVVDVIKLSNDEGCIVLLKDEAGKRVLPIWIGAFEGWSIAAGLENVQTPRPLTYRWIVSMMDAVGAELEEVRIEGLKEDTYLGTMVMRKDDLVIELDARPSDLLALAAHKGAPIYVGEEIMMKTGIDLSSVKGELKPSKGAREMIAEYMEMNRKFQETRSSEIERQNKREKLIESIFGPQ